MLPQLALQDDCPLLLTLGAPTLWTVGKVAANLGVHCVPIPLYECFGVHDLALGALEDPLHALFEHRLSLT